MQKTRVGLVPLIIAGFAWGTAGTLGTLLSRSSGLGFLAVAGYRNTIGGLLVLAVVLLTRRFRAPRTRAGWTRVLAIGAFSGGYQMCLFTSVGLVGVPLATQSSTTGSLITLLEPLTGAVWAAIILNQHLTPGGIVGAALLLAAVALAALPA